jgi:hypothetical protein
MNGQLRVLELFDAQATLHEIETVLWLELNKMFVLAEKTRERLISRGDRNVKTNPRCSNSPLRAS